MKDLHPPKNIIFPTESYKVKHDQFQIVDEEEIDLFENYADLPSEVQAVLDKFTESDNTYENCANLVSELNAVGYTCEYGLDAEPHGLRKL